jgi:PIN domain nuclease of toxin-antitoxin system
VSSVVLDASALLALIFEEPGAEAVREALPDAIMGMVNVCEVISKLSERVPPEEASAWVDRLALNKVDFDWPQSRTAGELRKMTRRLGLSLGDRACLALAVERELPVLTAERAWTKLSIGVDIRLVR